jgi:hypothetical protein
LRREHTFRRAATSAASHRRRALGHFPYGDRGLDAGSPRFPNRELDGWPALTG